MDSKAKKQELAKRYPHVDYDAAPSRAWYEAWLKKHGPKESK